MDGDDVRELVGYLVGDHEYATVPRDLVLELVEGFLELEHRERWDAFKPKEQELICVGLSLLSLALNGAMHGDIADMLRAGPEELARDLPPIVRLVSELSAIAGTGSIDVDTQGALVAVLDQKAAESRKSE